MSQVFLSSPRGYGSNKYKSMRLCCVHIKCSNGVDGSIFIVEIAFNPTFWATVMDKVSDIYLAWVLPLIFEYIDVPKQSINTDKSLQPVINLDEYEETNQTYVIATVKGLPLFQEDLNCLSEGGEITDNIIGVFMRYIMEQFKGIEDLAIAESFFYLSLTQDTALSGSFEENYRQASSYITSISPRDNLVSPICAYGHWCAIIIAQGLAIVLDSLSHIYDTITRDNEIDSISSYLKWQNPEMNINF